MNSIFKGKGIIVGYTAALLLAAGLAFALSALPPGAGRERQEAAAAAKYKEALALMDGGSMDEALGLLEELPYGYRDVYPLTAYIEALRLYEAGEDPYYYDVISRLSHISEDYPGEYSSQISALRRQALDNFGRETLSAQGGGPHAHTISHAVLPAHKPRICRQRAGRPIQRGGLHGPGGLL